MLICTEWHHTSSYYNETDFYEIDEDNVEDLTIDKIKEWQIKSKKIKSEKNIYKADFEYIEWGGTRNYPKKYPHTLKNVNVEEKGSFYIVTDDNGKELVRKKINSNGTKVTKLDTK